MQYRIGTASFASGSNVITGSGTEWLANVSVGDWILAPNKLVYIIQSIPSDTQVTITVNYGGTTVASQPYVIHRDFYDGKPIFDDTDVRPAAIINEWVKDSPTLSDLGTAASADLTTSSTDTTAGRVTKVGDFGLGTIGARPPSNNLNLIAATGFYNINGGDLNKPGTLGGLLFHIENVEENGATQQHTDFDGSAVYTRTKVSGVWGAWQELYHTGNLLGTVSQSSGVPTGAVIQRGSNANGEFVRFADGTQICTHRRSIGGGWAVNAELDRTWSFPAPFHSTPVVIPFGYGGTSAGSGIAQLEKTISVSAVTMRVKNNTAVNIGTEGSNIEVMTVIGRWY